jgi:hypothetical protein
MLEEYGPDFGETGGLVEYSNLETITHPASERAQLCERLPSRMRINFDLILSSRSAAVECPGTPKPSPGSWHE